MSSTAYDYHQLDSINQNLICCLCHSPFINPAQTPCSHVFCSSCITQAISHSPTCPVDRRDLTLADLKEAPVVIRNMVDELLVKCSCSELVQRQDFVSHKKSVCGFLLVLCGCEVKLLRKDMEAHLETCEHRMTECELCEGKMKVMEVELHIFTCPSTPTSCRHCSRPIPRSLIVEHAGACLLAPASCHQASNGCSWKGQRSLLPTHLETCPFDVLRSFFAINDARLTAESAMRRETDLKVAQLQEDVGTLTRELEGTKKQLEEAKEEVASLKNSLLTSLGPYAVSPSPSSPSPAAADFFLQPQSQPPTSFSSTLRLPFVRRRSLPSSHYLTFDPTIPPSDDPQSIRPLPSVLSAAPPQRMRPLPTPAQSPPGPIPGQQQTFFDLHRLPPQNAQFLRDALPPSPTGSPRSQQHQQSLSSTTEEGSPTRRPTRPPAAPIEANFLALVDTISDVVRAMDSLERKSDLMLTAETLRLMEEIGALRSITHSLRMQLHHITMNLTPSPSSTTTSTATSSRRMSASPGRSPGTESSDRDRPDPPSQTETVVSMAYSSRGGRGPQATVPYTEVITRRTSSSDASYRL
ncbi:hypothetical protein BDY24DRAFT_143448 [Mrakia frigida]|uniref:uncharacterized protein n=1 Tax=Mrakia frigida TaxID=29902 RepID=UPI003FCC10DA